MASTMSKVLWLAGVVSSATVKIASRQSPSPCQEVSSQAAAYDGPRNMYPRVDAKLAFDCLNSAPFKVQEASVLMAALMPFVEFQSTTAYLKSPPAGYPRPAIDLDARFLAITDNITANSYASEYDFQAELLNVFNAAHDSHFRFAPDLLSKALLFERPDNVTLVSVSMDGKEVPKIYVKDDIDRMARDSSFSPSALSSIDGQNANRVIEGLSDLTSNVDPDGAYNIMFYSPAFFAQSVTWSGYFGGTGAFSQIYPGPSTTLGFENGTTYSVTNQARVLGDFSGVTDGETLYQRFCTGPIPTTNSTFMASNTTVPTVRPLAATNTTSQRPVPTVNGYPRPVIITSDRMASGYYLPDSDVAVLSYLSFQPSNPLEWQVATEKFVAAAKADGKTKLIVDLQSNGGGIIFTGYDVFRQLFPQIIQDGNTRLKNSAGLMEMATDLGTILPADFNRSTSDNDTLIILSASVPNFRFDVDIDNQPFSSIDDKLVSNYTYQQDSFTPIIRWDLNDPVTTRNTTFGLGIDITGYQSRQNQTQPFAAADIIIIQDGFCGSTCTIFSEIMRTQGKVRTIAMGGRTPPASAPSNNSTGGGTNQSIPLIQGTSGTRGTNNFGMGFIQEVSQAIYGILNERGLKAGNETLLKSLTSLIPIQRSTDASINARDNILRENLVDGTPTQFLYEPAECRLFYTPAMMQNITALWQAAAAAAWGGGECNAGSLSSSNEIQSNLTQRSTKRTSVTRETEVIRMDGVRTEDRSLSWQTIHGMRVPF